MKAYIEVVLQTVLAFFSILFLTRLLGRQQVSQLTLQEYINGITFGSIAATLATDLSQRTWQHFIGLLLFGLFTFLISIGVRKNRLLSKLVQGEPVVVIQDGKILEANLSRFQYTLEDLNVLLRKKDVFDVTEVKYGILEPNGELSVMKVAEKSAVTVEDLNLKVKEKDIPLEVIVTGSFIYENLKNRGLTAQWLLKRLNDQGIQDVKEVYYATLDDNNQLYADLYQDHLEKNKRNISESDLTKEE
ncbi:YetF domain-containing protein [Alkaliphilus crotonatoxidans]